MRGHAATYLRAIVLATTLAEYGTASELPNWVSPVNASASGCYRKTYLSYNACAKGYKSDGIATCWAQCPLDYPVECGMECIPRTAGCTAQIFDKVFSVATVALNTATAGVFGKLRKTSGAVQLGVKCGQQLYSATSALVSYVDDVQANATLNQRAMGVVNESDIVTTELPAAVSTCLNLPVSPDTPFVAAIVDQIVAAVAENGSSLLNSSSFLALMSDAGVDESIQNLDTKSQAQLQDVLSANATCGAKLHAVVHELTQFVVAMKQKDPLVAVSTIRQEVSASDLFTINLPDAINDCSRNLKDNVHRVLDNLRSVMSTIVDGLVDSAVDGNGKTLSSTDYLLAVADMGIDVIAILDPTGIADMVGTFLQPICGPTVLVGEIDDGSLTDALSLTTEGQVFRGSYGTWRKVGDGTVNIVLQSLDSEDVTVVIRSGGDTVARVKVASGSTVSWNATVKDLQDKTLYLERYRQGRFRLPSSRGGSLLMWVPHASAGGKIDLHVVINGGKVDSSGSTVVRDSNPDGASGRKGETGKTGMMPLAPAASTDVDHNPTPSSSLPSAGKTGISHDLGHVSAEAATSRVPPATTTVDRGMP
ncbi:unnamed protein product [Hyaloperonospora brassicae]|uniref:Uncharacterized protein n=1 Tax=Hyaloperonospora brassicae TaxID=162125 RepID=A0AAV0T953_HYABA|nr:unnamed protein product [Hyaloperonospora brassicae]